MCTVSWVHEADGYHVFCNRDEKRTRLPARPPAIECTQGVRFVAPRDADFGGTWLAANEFGVSLCLLNGEGPAPRGAKSRGAIIPSVIAAGDAPAAMDFVSGLDTGLFAPFRLVAIDAHRRSRLFLWDGARTRVVDDAESWMPLTSSSFDTAQVCAQRQRSFHRLRAGAPTITSKLLFDFHCSHDGPPSAYSTCMHRDDAETVSFSWITVRRQAVQFLYSPFAPCRGKNETAVTLEFQRC